MSGTRFGAFVAALVVSWLSAMPAMANPFDVYGAGTRSTAMGSAQVANSEGPSATYDNVAGLADSSPQLTVGAFSTFLHAPILLKDRPDGYDVPDLGTRSPALPSEQTRRSRSDSDGPRALYGITAGLVTDFGGTKSRGGILVMLPTNGLIDLRTHFADERERYFSNQLHHELIGSRIHRPVVELGVARRLTDRLAFGVGGTYQPGALVTTEAYIRDPSDQSDVDLNADVYTTTNWGLLAGLTVDLPVNLKVGLAYRSGVSFRIDGANEVQVRGIDEESQQDVEWVPVSTPTSLRAGISWAPGDVEVSLDGRYTFWSTYVNTHGESAGFSNTIQGRLGAEWSSSEDTKIRAGLGFIPTPVPDQTGRTNYVDNSRLLSSVGGGHAFELLARDLEASWFIQFQHLVRRETDKEQRQDYPDCTSGERALCDEVPDDTLDPQTGQPYPEAQGLQTGNPGFPGFTSGGWLGSIGFEIRY